MVAVKDGPQGGHAACHVELRRAGADPHDGGDLGFRQIRVVPEYERLSLPGRERAQCRHRAGF